MNNSLVDYAKAPTAGFYTFQVPLVYGNSLVKLRFYGPWGEELSREQNIQIPFNFLPVKGNSNIPPAPASFRTALTAGLGSCQLQLWPWTID
jgi:hypothetical protein